VERVPHRKVPDKTRVDLWVSAGGRCEFDGCNRYLLRDSVTGRFGVFAELAHIVAFKKDGPRGRSGQRPKHPHEVSNLMLLCQEHHKAIDDDPQTHHRIMLEKHKTQHEERVLYLTGLDKNIRTTILQVRANIGGQPVRISRGEVLDAIAPRYPTKDSDWRYSDLGQVDVEAADAWGAGAAAIKSTLDSLQNSANNGAGVDHVSVFALAPIPLLVFLGRHLSSKVTVDLYQRHRATVDGGGENWKWKSSGPDADYVTTVVQTGTDKTKVALVLSLSGKVDTSQLPGIDARFYVYEMTLAGRAPGTDFLRRRKDLDAFCVAYRDFLARLHAEHGTDEVALFPAVPAPIAVCCGRERLPKVQPALLVHDANRAKGGFAFALKVE